MTSVLVSFRYRLPGHPEDNSLRNTRAIILVSARAISLGAFCIRVLLRCGSQEWRKNVSKASELGQRRHVFYFQGRKGQGKVAWNQLPDEEAAAVLNTGVGGGRGGVLIYRFGAGIPEHYAGTPPVY